MEFSDPSFLPFRNCNRTYEDVMHESCGSERHETNTVIDIVKQKKRELITCSPDFVEELVLGNLNQQRQEISRTIYGNNEIQNSNNQCENVKSVRESVTNEYQKEGILSSESNQINSHPKIKVKDFKIKIKYQCEYCGKGFLSREKFKAHTAIHFLENSLECDFCHLKFAHKTGFTRHVRSHAIYNDSLHPLNSFHHNHDFQSAYNSFYNSTNSLNNINNFVPGNDSLIHSIHSDNNLIQSANTLVNNGDHNRNDGSNGNLIRNCNNSPGDNDNLIGSDSNSIHNGNNTNHSDSNAVRNPNNCVQIGNNHVDNGNNLTTLKNLRNNLNENAYNSFRNNDNPFYYDDSFTCDICRQIFSSKPNFEYHKWTHTRVQEEKQIFQCRECKKEFVSRSSLNTHEKRHKIQKQYKCDDCGENFNKKISLDNHMKIHSGKKTYQCNECSHHFTTKLALSVHQRIHTGVKPYKCGYCEKSFTCKFYLDTHIRVHTGEKPFECNICKKSFSQKSTLNTHKKIHFKANN